MAILTKTLRKYLLAETKKNYTKETQYSYDNKIRQRTKSGIDDLILIAEKAPGSWRSKIFQDRIGKLVENILIPKEESGNEYYTDAWAYETALSLLHTLNNALNKILNPEKMHNMRRMNPDIQNRYYYPNIAILEMMLIAYFDKM